MENRIKFGILGAALLLAFAGGWSVGHRGASVSSDTKSETQKSDTVDNSEHKSTTNDQITTKTTTTKPDGTKIVTEKTETVKKDEETKTRDETKTSDTKKEEIVVTTPPKETQYRLTALWTLDVFKDTGAQNPPYPSEILASRRLLGNLWLDGGYMIQQKQVTFGLSMEF